MKIVSVLSREVLDSRGNPTVEVEVVTENSIASAIAPSGASTGMHEAHELRDGGSRYLGKGVLNAVENVTEKIAPAIIGMEVYEQKEIDQKMIELDGTKEKKNLGANAIIATSMAVFKACAASSSNLLHDYMGGSTMPRAMFNIINGGKHAGGNLAIQEFMIIPEAPTFSQRLRMASEIYHTLGKNLAKKYGPSAKNVGDEGGFTPNISNTYQALDEILAAATELGYSNQIALAVDAAASSFYNSGKYSIDGKELSEEDLLDYYVDLCKTYPLISIEDPFYEESFSAFAHLLHSLPKVQIVGDDLLVTNTSRIQKAIDEKSVNALLLKVNQIGTVTEAIEAAKLCKKNHMNVIVSHRSGESEDTFIADFSVGLDAGQIKTGAPARGERTAKYNQLLRIEEWLIAKEMVEKHKPF